MMAQSLIACPLCSAASFSSSSALCLSLVSVGSKWLRCTLCEEELHGLDKFTIHLLGHLIHTNNFKNNLTTDHTVFSDFKQISHTEPLNLVKTHKNFLKESINEISPALNINDSLSYRSKDFASVQCERESLKIDDEVMIFFNHCDKSPENKNTGAIDCVQKTGLRSPSTDFSKLTFESNQDVEKHSNSILSEEYFPRPPTYDGPHYLLRTGISPSPSAECPCKPVVNEMEMELSQSGEQEDKIHECIETNKNSDAFQKETSSKSSFLSPSGERVLGFRCDVCSLVFPDEQILSMHRRLIHAELSEDTTKEKKYKCHLCSKSFIMRGSLMVHMRVAHFGGAVVTRLVEAKQLETNAVSPDSAQYVCSICNKGFTKEQQLSQHEKLHEGKQCDVCLKTFTTKYFLRKHKRLHTGEMPYSCNICNKSFTFQQSYHKHLLYHSDDKPYSCGECGRAFKELSTLHNHERIHTGEKPFSCETCGKCFRQRVSYLVHRRIHTGLMPYKCQDCGKTFRYKVSERTHKCTVSGPGNISESLEIYESSNKMNEDATLNFTGENKLQDTSEETGIVEQHWHEKQVIKDHQGPSRDSDTYPEPTDFFSLMMYPSVRLQHLSLSAGGSGDHNNIDTEALKQLLYEVDDYN